MCFQKIMSLKPFTSKAAPTDEYKIVWVGQSKINFTLRKETTYLFSGPEDIVTTKISFQ